MDSTTFLIILFIVIIFVQYYINYNDCVEHFGQMQPTVQSQTIDSPDGTQDVNLTVNNNSDPYGYYQYYQPYHYYPYFFPWYLPTRRWSGNLIYPHMYNYYRNYY